MNFVHARFPVALLSLILTSVAFGDVIANRSDSRPRNCKDLLCNARKSCDSARSTLCVKKESNITIWLNENETAYDGILLIYNKAGCEASLLSETKARGNAESCNATLRNHCTVTKELYIEIRQAIHERKTIGGDGREQDTSSRFKIGFKLSFKCQMCSIKQHSVSIVIRKNEDGSISAPVCLTFDKNRSTKRDICRCSVQTVFTNPVPVVTGTNATNSSRLKPKLSEEGRNNRKVVRLNSAVFCFVLLCLLLEMLLYVVLHLWLQERYRRTSPSLEVENSASNPSYQPGLQRLGSSNSSPLPVTSQEIYQPPYQPLVESTRGPGVSTRYHELTVETRVPTVEPAFYQDLVENVNRENVNHGNTSQGEDTGEPLYYVLEELVPTKEGSKSPHQRSDFSESLRDPLYHVLKELRSLNANVPNRAPSDESLAEPIYYVLENPRENEEKNTQDTKM